MGLLLSWTSSHQPSSTAPGLSNDHKHRPLGPTQRSLEEACKQLQECGTDHSLHETFRAASPKEFEFVLDQSGTSFRKRLRPIVASGRHADRLILKNVFRHTVKRALMSAASCEHWFAYQEIRNDTAHDYGERFTETVLKLLPDFITDAKDLARVIAEGEDD